MPAAILFVLFITVSDTEPPFVFNYPMENLDACLAEVREFATHPPRPVALGGGKIQVGCVVTYPPSVEH